MTEVILACHHVVRFRSLWTPRTGEEIWCVRCQSMCRVTHSSNDDWNAQCQDCKRLKRHYGPRKLACEVAAAKHHQRYPGHTIHIYNGSAKMRTLRMVDIPLPVGDDAPPF